MENTEKCEEEYGETTPNIKDNKPDVAVLMAEIIRLKEENHNLKMEARKKDVKLEEVEHQLMETTLMLDQIADKNGIFHRFSMFPSEIRQLIYSKMTLSDRISAAKATQEMEVYFTKYRFKDAHVKVSVEEEKDHVYIRIKFPYDGYVEFHRIPEELVDRVRRDLKSSKDCRCDFCDDNFWDDTVSESEIEEKIDVRYFEYDPHNVGTVFDVFRLVETSVFYMKSAPVGGLVDLLLPVGRLAKPAELQVRWHLEEEIRYPRSDPNINVKRWGKWFDFSRPDKIEISTNYGKQVSGSDPDEFYWYRGPVVYIPKDFYEIESFRNAKEIDHSKCAVDINYRQLISLAANDISIDSKSKFLTQFDLLVFFKVKIKQWVSAPDTKMSFYIQSEEKCNNPPYLNFERLLADVCEELETPDFRIYPNYYFFNPTPEHNKNSVSIRNMTLLADVCEELETPDFRIYPNYYFFNPTPEHNKNSVSIRNMTTGQCLLVSTGRLQTGAPDLRFHKDYEWPEKHGL